MRRYFISAGFFVAVGAAVTCVSPQPAGAFVAKANGVANAATAANTIIDVKHKGTPPPGWHHGRKTGWHKRGEPGVEPPGLAKKP